MEIYRAYLSGREKQKQHVFVKHYCFTVDNSFQLPDSAFRFWAYLPSLVTKWFSSGGGGQALLICSEHWLCLGQ